MSGLIPRLKQPPHMFRLKEHLFVRDDYECSYGCHNDSLHTFCLRRHCDPLLHKVNEHMIDHACQDRAVARQIHPRDYESKGNAAYEEIDHIHGIHHESRLVRPPDEYERKMPERPQRPEYQ